MLDQLELTATKEGEVMPAGQTVCTSRWLEVLSHIDPSFGGLSAAVPDLAKSLRERHGMDARVAAFCGAGERPRADMTPETLSMWPSDRRQWLTSGKLRKEFAAAVEACDGVHLHGLWEASSHVGALAARSQRKPYVVSAHGMLEPWALAQKALKKRVYGSFVERPVLERAACLRALTSAEAADYRRFGCKAPIAVIPNAVEAPVGVDPEVLLRAFPELRGKRLLLFMGRLHHKKGVRLLLEAWAAIHAEFPGVLLVLAGPAQPGDDSPSQLIAEHKLGSSVVLTGMLAAPLKWAALSLAEIFILPSYSEGLSVAILEALCMGVPCIVSEQCHMAEIGSAGAGWVTRTEEATLRPALREALTLSAEARREFQSNAAALAARKFSWQTVSQQMAELYNWCLGGTRPEGFELLEVAR